jgi:hypothetical protein
MPEILGYLEQLDDTRLVFLGQREDEPNTFYVGFRNSEGVDTKLTLSRIAMDALIHLHGMLEGERRPFPSNLTNNQAWMAVVSQMKPTVAE